MALQGLKPRRKGICTYSRLQPGVIEIAFRSIKIEWLISITSGFSRWLVNEHHLGVLTPFAVRGSYDLRSAHNSNSSFTLCIPREFFNHFVSVVVKKTCSIHNVNELLELCADRRVLRPRTFFLATLYTEPHLFLSQRILSGFHKGHKA